MTLRPESDQRFKTMVNPFFNPFLIFFKSYKILRDKPCAPNSKESAKSAFQSAEICVKRNLEIKLDTILETAILASRSF